MYRRVRPLQGRRSVVERWQTSKVPRMFRQGDVLIVPVAQMPAEVELLPGDGDRIVLAHGEVTGHAHAIRGECAALFRDPKLAAIFMLVPGDKSVMLEHEEHAPIAVPPGAYRIVRQREYSRDATRYVAD